MKTEEIIKEAIKRGYITNAKFYDAIYHRPFVIKNSDYNDFSMDGFKLYVKIYKQEGIPNKSACIYYNGRWAVIEKGESFIEQADKGMPCTKGPFDKNYYNEDNFYLNLMEFDRKKKMSSKIVGSY